jgi:acetolactate synthase I/II/III large subunit
MATSGPGATNMVTGIATAMMDSSPIVCITGQVASYYIGYDAFQETDITGITLPITKHNYLVTDVRISPTLREAFYIARTGRPGPVLIDIAKDAQQKPRSNGSMTNAHPPAGLPRSPGPPLLRDAARAGFDQQRQTPGDPGRARGDAERRDARTARFRRNDPEPPSP